MRGNSHYALKQYEEAKPDFETVEKDESSLFRDEAIWYLADCYLKTNERDKAIENLKNIAASESNHKKQAAKILRKLN